LFKCAEFKRLGAVTKHNAGLDEIKSKLNWQY